MRLHVVAYHLQMHTGTVQQALSPSTRRVLVVDEQAVVRNALVALIDSESPALICVGAATSVAEVLQLASDTQPNVIILDADLAGEDGVALIPHLMARTSCTVVVLSSHVDDGDPTP